MRSLAALANRSALTLLAALAALPTIGAQTLYWDINGPTAGSSADTTAVGIWGSNSNWSSVSDGTAATQGWANGGTAVFSAGTNATGAYTVTHFGELTTAGIQFLNGNVTVAGSNTSNFLFVPEVAVGPGLTATINTYVQFLTFTKTGDGLLRLSGRIGGRSFNERATAISVANGELRITGAGTALSPASNVAAGFQEFLSRAIDFSGASGTTFSIADGAQVAQLAVVLRDQLDFRVQTGGTLDLWGNLSVGSGTPTFTLAGGSLSATRGSATVLPPTRLATGTTSSLSASPGNMLTLSGQLLGDGAIDVVGTSTVTIAGDNSAYTGPVTLRGGTLVPSHARSIGVAPPVFAGGNFLVQSGLTPTYTAPFVVNSGRTDVTGAGTTLTSTVYLEAGRDGNGTLALSAGGKAVSGNSVAAGLNATDVGTITIDGTSSRLEAGTFLILGNATGATGNLNISNSGAAAISSYALVGNQGTGALSVSTSGTLSSTDLNLGAAAGGQGTLTISSGGVVTSSNSGTVSFGSSASASATVTGPDSVWNIGGYLEVGHDGAGTLTVSDAGRVAVTASTALALVAGSSGTVSVTGSDSRLTSGTAFFNGYAGTGAVTIGTGGALAADYMILGHLGTGTGSLTVNDGGTARLGGLALGEGTGTVTLAGGSLEVINRSFTSNAPITLASATASTVFVEGLALQLDGVVSGDGSLTKTGTGALVLNAANTHTGGTTLNGGTLALAHADALSSGPVTLTAGTLDLGTFSPTLSKVVFQGGSITNGSLTNTSAFEVVSDSLTVSLGGNGTLNKKGSGTSVLTGDHTFTGGTTISAGTLQLGNGGTTGSLASATIANEGNLTINRSDTATLASVITGGGSFTHAGTGTTILTADNTFSGPTTITQGVLQLGTGGTTGAVGSSEILVNGVFAFNRSDNLTLAVPLSGSGTLRQAGTGTLTLAGQNTHTGGIQINSGAVVVADLDNLSTGVVTLDGGRLTLASGFTDDLSSVGVVFGSIAGKGGTLDTNGNDLTFATTLFGFGNFTRVGAGTLTLSANTAFAGAAVLDGGTLRLATSGKGFANPASLTLGRTAATTLELSNGATASFLGRSLIGELEPGSLSITGGAAFNTGTDFVSGGTSRPGLSGPGGMSTPPVNGTGTVTVSGPGSLLTVQRDLVNGDAGDSNFTIADGALVSVSRDAYIGRGGLFETNSSALNLTGVNSRLHIGGLLHIGNTSQGTLNIADGGSVRAGSGGILLGNFNFISASLATLNLGAGGTLEVGGTDGLRASTGLTERPGGTFESSTAPTTVNFSGGTLRVISAALTSSVPATLTGTTTVDTNGLAATFSGILSGSGALTKSGAGTLTLSAANTYTGFTEVRGGVLLVDGDSLSDTSKLVIDGGKVLTDVTETVDTLFFGEIQQAAGFWGSSASSALPAFQDDTRFSGTGLVEVITDPVTVDDYTTWATSFGLENPWVTLGNPALNGEPSADADNDGMNNQQEYAFGLNPTSGASSNPITVQLNKTTGKFSYTRRATPESTGLDYTITTSTNLVAWPADLTAVQTVTGTVNGVETVEVTLSGAPLNSPALFVRVKAD